MKYMQTADGKIWGFLNSNNNFLYELSDTEMKHGKWIHEIGTVIREANTLEELTQRNKIIKEL